MTTAPKPVVHARAASEAIRQINHLTIGDNGGLDLPSELSDVVSALAQMAERLPQALGQLARITRQMANDPNLYDDQGELASYRALLASGLLADNSAPSLADDLRRAADHLSHLGVRDG